MSIILPEARRIAALVPHYSPTGDSTVMITVDGQSVPVPLRIRTIVKRLALSHAADLAAIKKHAASATQRANLQPLPLTHGLILCPIKMRTPRVIGDATTGYVNYYAVTGTEKSPDQSHHSTICLAGGTKITALWTVPTVKKQLHCARLLLTQMQSYSCGILSEPHAPYVPDILPLVQKFVEVICDIVAMKQKGG